MLGDPKGGEDIPSYKDLVQELKKPKELEIPKGVKFEKKWFLRKFGYVLLIILFLGVASYRYGSSPDWLALGIILVFIGIGGVVIGIGRRAIIHINGDEIIVEYKSGWIEHYTELKINEFKLDEKITRSVKFKVGENEDRVFELRPKGWLKSQWIIKIDGQKVGKLP